MTPDEFRRIRQKLNISRGHLALFLGVTIRSVRNYENDDSNHNATGTVEKVMKWLDDGTLTIASDGLQSE